MRCFLNFIIVFGFIRIIYTVLGDVIDICDKSRSKHYVPVGSSGFISTKTINSFLTLCQLQLVSCHACVIVVNVRLFDMHRQACAESQISAPNGLACRCDRIEITEPLDKIYYRKQLCVEMMDAVNSSQPQYTYRSQTRGLGLLFVHSSEYEHPFTIEYTAKYNIHHIEVDVDVLKPQSAGGTINSPFFPIQYPADIRSQYRIRCSVPTPEKCAIRLIFSDHQLAAQSVLEFFEEGRKRIGLVTGRIFRPPAIISNGPNLSVNFYANQASGFGFKANYSVVIGDAVDADSIPKTACGGFVESTGGTVVMARMTQNVNVFYDCIWIVKPLQRQTDLRTHLYLKITNFYKMGTNSQLTIHNGPTSSHRLLQRVAQQNENWMYEEDREHVTYVNAGFYVAFSGTFTTNSSFALSYAAFSFSHSHNLDSAAIPVPVDHDCYLASDFLCQNRRCIDSGLRCDGFDHCGDSSDEEKCVYGADRKSKWSTVAQNFYFPSTDSYPSLPTGFFAAFCASFITFIVCSLFCSVIYRTKQQHDYSRLRAISEVMNTAAQQRSLDQINNESVYIEEPPPEYEFPPNYQDVFVYNTMKKVISDSKTVQNSAIQTELNEPVETCCSSRICVCNHASNSQFNHVAASEGESSHDVTLFARDGVNVMQPVVTAMSSAGRSASLQFTLVTSAKVEETNSVTVDTHENSTNEPTKSINNFIVEIFQPIPLNVFI